MRKSIIILSCIFLTCCSNTSSEANNKTSSSPTSSASPVTLANSTTTSTPGAPYKVPVQDPEMNESGFKPSFIAAADLLKKIQNKEDVYIIDVRGQMSYDEGHIKGAIARGLPITPESVANIPKDAHVVTYCGCPHHLSSIGAEQLTNMGYKDVHVLNEGFWYWKDHNFPMEVAENSKSKITEMSVAGVLMKDGKPLGNTDIYMKHVKTGQLEAEKTDKDGKYKMNFHLYNYQKNDEFKFYVSTLNNEVQSFATDKKDSENVIVNVK